MIKHTKLSQELQTVVDKAVDALQNMLDKRYDTFDNRSEAWQDSEKGEEYSDDTVKLSEIVDHLNELYSLLEDTFE